MVQAELQGCAEPGMHRAGKRRRVDLFDVGSLSEVLAYSVFTKERKMQTFSKLRFLPKRSGMRVLILGYLIFGSALALAWDKETGIINPTYQAECAACHVAFQPAFLSANSWRAVMGGLDRHFGFDVTLSETERKGIEYFLVTHAGVRKTDQNGKPQLRVTETRWFVREHLDHLPAGAWQHVDVKSATNCVACHSAADKGNYSERTLKLPKGMKEKS